MRQIYTTSRTYPLTRAMAGLAMGLGFYLFCRSMLPSDDVSFVYSPLYRWGWVLLPMAAFALAYFAGEWGPAWGPVLLLPQAVAVIIEGGLLDSTGGFNLGTREMYLVLINALVVAGAGTLGLSLTRRHHIT